MQKQTFQIGKSFIPGILFSACSAVLLLFAALIIASPVATTTNATDEPDYADGLSLVTSQVIEATIRPEDTGTLSIIKDTIVGATNSQYGYEVYISTNSDTVNDIYLNGNSENNETTQKILATSGTYAAPAALDLTNGATWGYAIAGLDSFDASYNTFTPSTTSKFAAVPTSDNKQLIHRNISAAADDDVDIYYGINTDSSLEPGMYKTEILYTAVPITPPPLTAKAIMGTNGNLNFVYDQGVYNVGDTYTDNLGNTDIVSIFNVPMNSTEQNMPAWVSNNTILSANFSSSFYNFEPTSTAYWFYENKYLESITGAENLNTSNVTTMLSMFMETGYEATAWSISNISNWNLSSVTDMAHMFDSAGYKATTWDIGDISNWSTNNVTDTSYMFYDAGNRATSWNIGNLGYVDANHLGWDMSSNINMKNMFSGTGNWNATSWNIGDIGSWDVTNVTDMSWMFNRSGMKVTTWNPGDLSSWNVGNVIDMSGMFANAGQSATTWNIGDISGWDVGNVTGMQAMFYCAGENATTWDIGNLGYIDASHPGWNVSSVTNMRELFYSTGYYSTTWDIGDIGGWNVSNVTNMYSMFGSAGYNAAIWDIGDIGRWNVSNVSNMEKMFFAAGSSAATWNIGNLGYIDANHPGWNVGSVTTMENMFAYAGYDATSWSIGDISSWNVSSVKNMYRMFAYAGYNATYWSIGDISGWDVSSVTNHGSFIDVNVNYTNLSVFNNQPNWQ
ncbi:MAG: DUF285 domain-containing protein [Candidatus Saccharibacteria bacterium]|nr:DUF285 domain-containing protein [Candidatus Saccharibacteria bacterium]